MKTQTRIALVLFFSTLLIVLVFGGAVYYALNKYSYNDFYKRLETRSSIAINYYLDTDRLNAEALKKVREKHLERLFEEKEYWFQIEQDSSLAQLAIARRLPLQLVEKVYDQSKYNYKKGQTLYSGIKHTTGNKKYIVIVSADNYYVTHHLNFLRNVLIAGIILTALLTILLSFYFSRQIFEPIRRITDKVKAISTENMQLRLEEHKNNNEISELAVTFNDLLTRIETAFETQKNFISNASHEFRTPLTSIIGEADVTLKKERSTQEYQETIGIILKHAERLDKVVNSLLFLAQTGYEGKKIVFQRLRIDEIIWEVKALMNQLIPDNQIQIDLSLVPDDPLKLKIRANKELLSLALANILNNACKYSYNRLVTVNVGVDNKDVVIVIRDTGIGIPESEMKFIYDPYFRASNVMPFDGHGIGLPLARNILHLHKGTLSVSSIINKGTVVQLNIPIYV